MPTQSEVHGSGKKKKNGLRQKYARAAKQLVDTFAPGMNPRRTKNRAPKEAE